MFCVYKNGAVEKVFSGEHRDETGTYPAAHLLAIGQTGRAALDVYLFDDHSDDFDGRFYTAGATDDAPPDGAGTVVRTVTPVEKDLASVRAAAKAQIMGKRSTVAHSGVIFSGLNFKTDTTTIESINLITTALLDGETFPGGSIPWDTMKTPKVPSQIFAATEVQFKALRNHIAAHFVLATKQAREHADAVDALGTPAEVIAYDQSTGWPVNPDMSEPE